jgi:hypothetical protein
MLFWIAKYRFAFVLFMAGIISSPPLMKVGLILHWHWQKEVISRQYCENKSKPELNCLGKCHLKKQLSKIEAAQKTDQDMPLPERTWSKVFDPIFVSTLLDYQNYDIQNLTPFYYEYQQPLLIGFYLDIFHPPSLI